MARKILIAAADPLVRRALQSVLEGSGFEIACETGDAAEAIELAKREAPHVALVDTAIDDGAGLETVSRIVREAPQTRVVVLSATDDDQQAVRALRAGARGYLRKDIDLDALPRAVTGVMNGEAAISRRLTMKVVEELGRTPALGPGMRPTVSELTPREWEVLDLLTTGASTTDIAIDLVLSPETVLTHVKNILRKLGVHSRRDAVKIADELRKPVEPGNGGAAPPD